MQDFDEFWNDVCTYKLEVKHKFHILKKAIKYANGCGSKGGIKFPDSFLWVSIKSACNNHDIDWSLSLTVDDLINDNYRFRRNMERIIDAESANWLMVHIRMKMMNYYYEGVKLIGTGNYSEERGFHDGS